MIGPHELTLVRKIIAQCTATLAASIITRLQGLNKNTENDRGGQGYGLANLWEEYKCQFQMHSSDGVDRYHRVVWPLCEAAVEGLPIALQQLFWLDSDECEKLDSTHDDVTLADFHPTVAIDFLYHRLRYVAINERLIFDPNEECRDDYPPGG